MVCLLDSLYRWATVLVVLVIMGEFLIVLVRLGDRCIMAVAISCLVPVLVTQ